MFKKNTLGLSIAAVASLGTYTLPAMAQMDDALEEVVITGIRGSLVKASDVKRTKIQIVDAIVAEDIGKFPDNNVVEALQRVTGVQVTNHGSGEISGISIRGLTDVNTTVNGRNIFTASGLAVALQDVPASLIKEVDVYKTRSAAQIENGIAGSVDIKTQRPFDFPDQEFVLAGRAINQEQADKVDPNISGLASTRWTTSAGEFGALVNLSYARTQYRDQSIAAGAMLPFATDNPAFPFSNYQVIPQSHPAVNENPIWDAGMLNGLPSNAGATLNINGQAMPYMLGRDGVVATDFTGKRERSAANVSLQFAPNDTSEYLFEAFYNGYDNESYSSLLYGYTDWWGEYANDPGAANVVLHNNTNIVKSRSVAYPLLFTSGDLLSGETDSYVYALGGNWDIGTNLYVASELVYQDSEFSSDFFAMRFDRVAYGMDVVFNAGGGLPAFSLLDNTATANIDEANLTDLTTWNSSNLYDNANQLEGDAVTFTTDATLTTELGIFTSFTAGVRLDQRSATEFYSVQSGNNAALDIQNIAGLARVNSGFFDGNADVPTSWVAADGYYIRANADQFRTVYGLNKLDLIKGFTVDELTSSVYLTGKFESELAGKAIDGDVGVRVSGSSTDLEFFDEQTGAMTSGDTSNIKALPSLMLRYHWTDSLLSRFAYTETLRRPGFGQYNTAIRQFDNPTGTGTASSGNQDLEPTESRNYDLSLEWYFNAGSSVYVTLFQRDIDGLVIDLRRPAQLVRKDGSGQLGNYVLTQPYNAASGQLQGAELGAIWFPENLPGLLDGFGVQASYTMLDSEQTTPITNSLGNIIGAEDTSMFGVSDNSYSLVLAYEKNQLGVRLSYAWRSEFLSHYAATGFANPLEVWKRPESSMDLQVSYAVNDWLSLTLDGTNLTEEIYQTYFGDNSTTNNAESVLHSRTLALGARFTF